MAAPLRQMIWETTTRLCYRQGKTKDQPLRLSDALPPFSQAVLDGPCALGVESPYSLRPAVGTGAEGETIPQVDFGNVLEPLCASGAVHHFHYYPRSFTRGVATMIGRLSRLGLTLASVVLLFAGELSAQTISGIIAGKVTDPQQKALPSVAIIAHNPGTGRDFQASTDGQGYYRILEVPPGLYEVTALLGGFETQHHVNVRVDVNRTTVEDFPMKIQTKEESITV